MNYEDKLSRLQKDPCEFAQNAIEELLYIILQSVKNDEESDKLVNEMASIVQCKLGLEDRNRIDWNKIYDYVDWHVNRLHKYMNKSEILAALKSIKILDDDAINIVGKIDYKKIDQQILEKFREHIEDMCLASIKEHYYLDEEVNNSFPAL